MKKQINQVHYGEGDNVGGNKINHQSKRTQWEAIGAIVGILMFLWAVYTYLLKA